MFEINNLKMSGIYLYIIKKRIITSSYFSCFQGRVIPKENRTYYTKNFVKLNSTCIVLYKEYGSSSSLKSVNNKVKL